MGDGWLSAVTVASAVGCGVVAGVLFAFSTFVMRALTHLPGAEGLRAMQEINTAAPTPWFLAALFGTAATCVGLVIASLFDLEEPGAVHRLSGAACYLVAIVITAAYHVPRNDALAAVDPGAANAPGQWASYARGWTAWNHVRTVAAASGAILLTLAVGVE